MTVTDSLRVRALPEVSDRANIYQPSLPRGTHFRLAEGPRAGSGYWWYRVTDFSIPVGGGIAEGWVASADLDGTPWIGPAPEACDDFGFAESPITVSTFAELKAALPGNWAGCVTTPWVPPYWVTITLRDDGTYSSVALAGSQEPALYYGTDEDSPSKQYQLNDLQASLRGLGQIDIVFAPDSINRGELRNIMLMGDQLEFEFFHRGTYGPLVYRLYRIGEAD